MIKRALQSTCGTALAQRRKSSNHISAMTLNDVISFVSENVGREIRTGGNRSKFTIGSQSERAFVIVTQGQSEYKIDHDMIGECLRTFNETRAPKTRDYQDTFRASYILGLFKAVAADHETRGAVAPDRNLSVDLRAIVSDSNIDETTRQALIEARIGQGKFRATVLGRWNNRCAVTSSCTREGIRASHIKPWRASTNKERLDPSNGLPLVANLDALFDAGLISFKDSGRMIVSALLTPQEQAIYGVVGGMLTKAPPPESKGYLHYHRTNCFRA